MATTETYRVTARVDCRFHTFDGSGHVVKQEQRVEFETDNLDTIDEDAGDNIDVPDGYYLHDYNVTEYQTTDIQL